MCEKRLLGIVQAPLDHRLGTVQAPLCSGTVSGPVQAFEQMMRGVEPHSLHFIRKFVKCNRNPLIPNLLHLHELVIGIASVRSRSPVSGLGGRAKRPACGRAKRPAWGVEPSVQLGVEPSVQPLRDFTTCMNYCTQVRLLRDLLHLHELVIGNVAFISE